MLLLNKRNIFFLVDALIFVLGISIAGVGIWVLGDENVAHMSHNEPFAAASLIYKSAYIVITFGFTLAILGLVGCCAVCFEKSLVLCCFASFFTVPLLLIIAALSLAWYASEDSTVRQEMENELNARWKSQKIFSSIEKGLRCCGVKRYTDYQGMIPVSCMINGTTMPGSNATILIRNDTTMIENIYEKGCMERMQEVIRAVASIISGLSTTIIILMTIAIILALGIRRASEVPPANLVAEIKKPNET